MNDVVNISIEKDNSNSNINTDNSYTVIENVLYCSSPKRGIKSKSNTKNESDIAAPILSTINMHTSNFTFYIVKEASTDIGSKEDNINSQKSSNLISEFSISNFKSSNFENTNTNKALFDIEEKENKIDQEKSENFENFENEDNIDNKKYKSTNKKSKNEYSNPLKYNKYLSSKLDENKINNKVGLINIEENKSKEKKNKKKKYKYSSIESLENKKNNNNNRNEINTNKIKRFSSVNFIDDKKKKKILKYHFHDDNIVKDRNTLRDDLNNRDLNINPFRPNRKRQSTVNLGKTNNNLKLTKSVRKPVTIKYNGVINNDYINNDNKIKSKIDKKKKLKNNCNEDNIKNYENNYESNFDKNFISHPIQTSNDELKNGKTNYLKSTKILYHRQYYLIKEIDRDYENNNTNCDKEFKNNHKVSKSSKKSSKKNKKYNFNEKRKKTAKFLEGKNTKEVSKFNEINEEEYQKLKKRINNKSISLNVFRKGNNNRNSEKQKENEIFKYKKSARHIIQLDNNNNNNNKEKEYKLKSSITLNNNALNKKPIEKMKDNQVNDPFKRRNTIYIINEKRNNLVVMNNNITNKEKEKENDSFFSNEDDNNKFNENDNGYEDDCSSKNESIDEKITKMKIDKITEDKLILNYKNKNEIIELISDKENIDNYYEYLEICLETLQEMNLEEVPKSKVKIDFKFPNERKNKKIALLDLDETLVHCVGEINKNNCNNPDFKDTHKIKVFLPCKKEVTIGINIRPHLTELLDKIKDIYNIVIFTASHRSYSDAVLNYLDPEDKYFHYRLYRDSCVLYKKNDIQFYIKDLDIFKDNYNLKDILMIDNSILSFAYHLNNGIPVVPFYDSKQDNELPLLCFYLLSIASFKDLREVNKEHINLEFFLTETKNEISLDEESIHENLNLSVKESNNDNSIMNNIKINIDLNNASSKSIENLKNEIKNNNNYRKCSNLKLNENILKDDKDLEKNMSNKSEKKLICQRKVHRKTSNRRKFNTVKLESSKLLDFFDKWKNAYLQLALKK